MTLAISHIDSQRRVLDTVREVRPPFSPEQVVEDFAALLKSYGIHSVTGDRYGGEWPRERFLVHGISYEVADRPKSDLYRDLLPLLNSGQAELLDNAKLISQICNLERRTARGGRDSIDHPPNGHDDLANAVAGALAVPLPIDAEIEGFGQSVASLTPSADGELSVEEIEYRKTTGFLERVDADGWDW